MTPTGQMGDLDVSRRLRIMGLLTVVLVVAVVISWRVSDEITATARRASSPPMAADYQAVLAQQRCLAAEAHRIVPKGATVYAGPDGADSAELTESMQEWATVTPPTSAQWTVVLQQTGGPCYGEGIQAVRR